ncbi:MAG TPA: molybdopterin cofactor-binding domain-containing protein [Methylomirabilota bacterium]|jgi:carbon-monoxide dehydrogenase large subunit|nr:molybdopterin cofactor-binding domain-containing protein [Methylomirabilota bacterium]
MAQAKLFGSSIKRREDPRFITGKGVYTDDVKLPGQTHAVFVRSPHAHARVRQVDVAKAKAVPGVVAVYTGKDLAAGGVNPLPCGWLLPDIKIPEYRAIATGKVHFVGHAVAVVIAETPYAARDGADAVTVDYEELPSVSDGEKAVAKGAPQLHENAPGNVGFAWSIGDKDKTDAAIKSAAKVVKQRLVNQRLIPNAIEPRASCASFNSATGDLTLWVTSQNPHVHRLLMAAFVLGMPEHKMRVIAPDVGGGFGSKIFVYPEEVAVSWASKALGRPVKWTAERRESYVTDAHGRDHLTEVEMAVDKDGKITALRVKTNANLGAYLSTFAPLIPTYLYGTLLSGVYEIPNIYCEVVGAFTNTTPVDAYRGAGRPEATYLLERVCDLAARALGADPAEFRRKNFIPASKFPYQTPVAFQYDSGNYGPALDRALQMVDYKKLRAEQEAARKQGRYLGIGFATYIEACGPAPSQVAGALGAQAGLWESAHVRVHPTGKITVYTGSHSHGQGHETTFAQLAADELGLPFEDVEIVHGDTAAVPFGMGTYGSRSAAVGGAAIHTSIQKIKEKGKKIAAHLLEASEADLDYGEGKYFVKGSPGRAKTFAEVALMAYLAHNLPKGLEPGLEATSFWDPPNFVFPFGSHIAEVEVDPETGKVKVLRYVAVDDVGRVINPMIVDGMVHGGIAQGVAQALWEYAAYDANGQLVTGSMMDYALPKAGDLPSFETDRTVTPSPVNPMGIKGAGETGTIASTAAIANAVLDALAPLGITHIDLPLTPARIWAAVQAARKK